MKAKQKIPKITKPVSDTTPFYEQYTAGLRSFQSFFKEELEPDIFKSSLTYVTAETVYNHEKKLKNLINTIDETYKNFSQLCKKKDRAKTLNDLDITYECRLRDIVPIYKIIKKETLWVFDHHLKMKKQIEEVKLTRKPNIYPLSFMPTFELIIGEGLSMNEKQLDNLVPMIQRGLDLDENTYDRMEKVHFSNLEIDIVHKQQMETWKEENLTKTQKDQLKKLDDMVLYLYQLNIDILMSVRILRYDMIPKTSRMKLYSAKMDDLLWDLERYENDEDIF